MQDLSALPQNKISDLLKPLLSYSYIATQSVKGCTSMEIAEIERQANAPFSLPAEYKNFLQTMGKGAGKLFQGTGIYYPDCLDFQRTASTLLKVNELPPLPQRAFAFSIHQGYLLYFFYLDEGNDPPVYLYMEGQSANSFEKVNEKFSDYIKEAIEFYLQRESIEIV